MTDLPPDFPAVPFCPRCSDPKDRFILPRPMYDDAIKRWGKELVEQYFMPAEMPPNLRNDRKYFQGRIIFKVE